MNKQLLSKAFSNILKEEGILKEKNWIKLKQLVEDLALIIAIKEGEKSEEISEKEIMKILSK